MRGRTPGVVTYEAVRMFRAARDCFGVSGACDAAYPRGRRTAHVGRAARWATAALLTLAGCDLGSAGAAPIAVPAAPAPAVSGPGPSLPALEELDISDRSVGAALRKVAQVTHTAVVIDADASRIASCARVSVYAPAGMEPRALVALVGTALAPHGLRLEQEVDGLVVRRVAGSPMPATCASYPALPDSLPPLLDEHVRELVEGIRVVSDTEVLVTRATVDRLLADNSMLLGQARVVPHVQDGRPDGLKVYGIRRTSVASALGLQNGDMVSTIGGRDVSSPEHALEAYARLRGADRVVIELQRRGQPVRVTYRVVARLPPQ